MSAKMMLKASRCSDLTIQEESRRRSACSGLMALPSRTLLLLSDSMKLKLLRRILVCSDLAMLEALRRMPVCSESMAAK